MFFLNVVKLDPRVKFEMGRLEDGGYDLYSTINIDLLPGNGVLIPVGIMTQFPNEWVALVSDRGSMGLKGVMRQAGVVDSGYRGEWMVKLYNTGIDTIKIQSILENPSAKAIAQVVFVLRGKVEPMFVDWLGSSNRGSKWNGSTDA